MSDLMAAINSVVHLKTIAGLMIDERDRQKLASLKIELTEEILKTQSNLSKVLSSVIEKDGLIKSLTERISDMEARQNDKSRYHLRKIGTDGDFFAYQLRPSSELSERADEPMHLLCQPCLDVRKQKAVLKCNSVSCVCPNCGNQFRTQPIDYDEIGFSSRRTDLRAF